MTDARTRLRHELGGAEPPLQVLTTEELERLAELLHLARERQATALTDALDHGLSFVPRFVRGAVRRLLG